MSSSEAPEGAALLPGAGRFEILLAALSASLAFAAVFVVPLAGVLGVPFASVPLVRLAHRRNVPSALAATAIAVGILLGAAWAAAGAGEGLATGLAAAGALALPVASVGFLRAGSEPSRCYLGLCLAGTAFLAATLAAATNGPGPSPGAEVASSFDRLIPTAVESYSKAGADPETLARLRSTLAAARDFARDYLWGILGALWMLGAAIAFYTGAWSARPAATAVAVRYEALRVPALAAGLFVGSGAGFVLLRGIARQAAGNLLLPLLALYFVAGLSIICHFLRRWFRVRILRAGLYALAAYFPINVGVALLGLFDWYVDFRRKGEGASEKS